MQWGNCRGCRQDSARASGTGGKAGAPEPVAGRKPLCVATMSQRGFPDGTNPTKTPRCPSSPVPMFWRWAPWLALSCWSHRLALHPMSPECITTQQPSSCGKGQHPLPPCMVLQLCSAAVFAVVVPCYIRVPCVMWSRAVCCMGLPVLLQSVPGSCAQYPPLAQQHSCVGSSLFPCSFV